MWIHFLKMVHSPSLLGFQWFFLYSSDFLKVIFLFGFLILLMCNIFQRILFFIILMISSIEQHASYLIWLHWLLECDISKPFDFQTNAKLFLKVCIWLSFLYIQNLSALNHQFISSDSVIAGFGTGDKREMFPNLSTRIHSVKVVEATLFSTV